MNHHNLITQFQQNNIMPSIIAPLFYPWSILKCIIDKI